MNFARVIIMKRADEFFTPLADSFDNKIQYLNTNNSSVERTLITLEKAKKAHGTDDCERF